MKRGLHGMKGSLAAGALGGPHLLRTSRLGAHVLEPGRGRGAAVRALEGWPTAQLARGAEILERHARRKDAERHPRSPFAIELAYHPHASHERATENADLRPFVEHRQTHVGLPRSLTR